MQGPIDFHYLVTEWSLGHACHGEEKSPVSAQGGKTIRLNSKKKKGVRDQLSDGINIYKLQEIISWQRSLK